MSVCASVMFKHLSEVHSIIAATNVKSRTLSQHESHLGILGI